MALIRGSAPQVEEECPGYPDGSQGFAAQWVHEGGTPAVGACPVSDYMQDLLPYLRRPETAASYGRIRSGYVILRYALMHRGYRAVFFYRLARKTREKNLGFFLPLLNILNRILNAIAISTGSEIGAGLFIPHAQCIVIGYSSKIGRNVTVYQGVTLGQVPGKRKNGRTFPTIGDNVMLGAGAKILGPVTIGNNAMIGANAVVLSDIPENAVAAGVPARVVGRVHDNYPTLLKKERQHAFEHSGDKIGRESNEF